MLATTPRPSRATPRFVSRFALGILCNVIKGQALARTAVAAMSKIHTASASLDNEQRSSSPRHSCFLVVACLVLYVLFVSHTYRTYKSSVSHHGVSGAGLFFRAPTHRSNVWLLPHVILDLCTLAHTANKLTVIFSVVGIATCFFLIAFSILL